MDGRACTALLRSSLEKVGLAFVGSLSAGLQSGVCGTVSWTSQGGALCTDKGQILTVLRNPGQARCVSVCCGAGLHQIPVGPVHAGIIEPGRKSRGRRHVTSGWFRSRNAPDMDKRDLPVARHKPESKHGFKTMETKEGNV